MVTAWNTPNVQRQKMATEVKNAEWVKKYNKHCKTKVVFDSFLSFRVVKYSIRSNFMLHEYDCYYKFCKLYV
jgi:hypothetical protein